MEEDKQEKAMLDKAKEMVEKEKQDNQLPVEKKEDNVPANISANTSNSELPAYKYDSSKSIDENASDVAELKATSKAIEDEKFIEDIAGKKKVQISLSADLNKDIRVATKTAEKIEATTKIDVAFYEQWKAVLIWGGIDVPSKKPFMIFMLFLILPFYIIDKTCFELPITIIGSFLGAINKLLEKIRTFGKIARGIAFSMLIIGIIAIIVYLILFYLDKYQIINIF